MTDVERLMAIHEINHLKARYFRCVDTKDWDGLEAVFTADAVADYTPPGGKQGGWIVTGAANIVAFVKRVIAPAITVHHGHMPEIEVTSPETATGLVDGRYDLVAGRISPQDAVWLRPLPRNLRKDRRQMADKDAEINPPSRRRVVSNIGVPAILNRFSTLDLRDAGMPTDDRLTPVRAFLSTIAALHRGNISKRKVRRV
jgi:SnoaL-like domain